jgi:hypothetical protein
MYYIYTRFLGELGMGPRLISQPLIRLGKWNCDVTSQMAATKSERFSPKDFAIRYQPPAFHFLRWKILNGPPFLSVNSWGFSPKITPLPEKTGMRTRPIYLSALTGGSRSVFWSPSPERFARYGRVFFTAKCWPHFRRSTWKTLCGAYTSLF